MDPKYPRSHPLWQIYTLLSLSFPGLGQCGGDTVPRSLVNGCLGEAVKLTPSFPIKTYEKLIWKHITEWGRTVLCGESTVKSCKELQGDRITLNPSLLALELNSLQQSDQGLYRIEAGNQWKIEHVEQFDLRVSEAVTQPIIQTTTSSANGTCHVMLKCMVQNGRNITFTWQLEGRDITAKDTGDTLRGKWKTLEIELSPNFSQSYSCTARNPGCNHTVTIHLDNSCNHGDDTAKGEDEPGLNLTLILVTVSSVCLLIILVPLTLFLRFRMRQDHSAEAPDQSISVYAQICLQEAVSQTPQVAMPDTIYSVVSGPRAL